MSKLCFINGKAPKYREAIFKEIESKYDCDWYFGFPKTDIKGLDLSLFKCASKFEYFNLFKNYSLYWKKNTVSILFKKKYQVFIISVESRALSDYVFLFLKYVFFPHKKIYAWTHGWYGKETKFEARLKMWQFRHLDGIFCYGNYARDLLIKQGIPSDKVYTIHNSLDYKKQLSIRKNLSKTDIYASHFGNTAPVIIFIGRLTKIKQLDMLVSAIKSLKDKGEFYNLVFVGDGEERDNLEKCALKYGIDNQVWFYGACYEEIENAELIYNSDLCVAPGNIGLTAMHTMVYGTPVVSHNNYCLQMPEFEAIRPGETGDFFEYKNLQSLVETISRWFETHKMDRDIVRKACYKEIDNFWTPTFQMKVLSQHLNI